MRFLSRIACISAAGASLAPSPCSSFPLNSDIPRIDDLSSLCLTPLPDPFSVYRERLSPACSSGPAPLTEENRKEIEQFFSSLLEPTFTFEIREEGEEIDKFMMHGLWGIRRDCSPHYEVTLQLFEDAWWFPLQIDGQIEKVRLTFRRDSLPAEKIESLPPYYYDCCGNLTFTSVSETSVALSIMPATPFCPAGEQEGPVPLSLDLTALGLGTVSSLLYGRSESPIAQAGVDNCYFIYTNMPHEEVMRDFQAYFDSIAEGAGAAEKALNLTPGSRVKQLMIVNASSDNAFFSARNPHAINLHDECLTEKSRVVIFARHESLHLLDLAFNLSSDYASFWKDLTLSEEGRGFLRLVNESEFIDGLDAAGHTHSNHFEFFASFANNILEYDVETLTVKIQQLDALQSGYGQRFYTASEILLSTLTGKGLADCPLAHKLRELLSQLEQAGMRPPPPMA